MKEQNDPSPALQEAKIALERLKVLADLIWETRWITDASVTRSEVIAYDHLVGIAAAIRSGNFSSIDKLRMEKKP